MPDFPPLVLATGSRYKRRLMERLGVDFSSRSADIDESRRSGESPLEMARRLAADKADAVASADPDAAVLASDQVPALGDRIFRKPGGRRAAVEQLRRLAGSTHQLVTAVALQTPDGRLHTDEVVYQMQMRPLTDDQIRRYVDEDAPFDCAGAYKIEAAGIRLFEATRGDDPTAIQGLALTRVWSLLLQAGWTDE